jgi:BirA family biotin operon repressor/biotin-[acetyl-CoA-carboxylase] ligase
MDQPGLETALADLPLPGLRYFDSVGSTNDEAWHWFDAGASHAALVVADAQTSGRGRHHRHWVTLSGSGLAFSMLLKFPPLDQQYLNRLVGLGALAVCKTLQDRYKLPAQIKWPNDVLLNQRKVAGVLVETRWEGERLLAAVLGIGINIAPPSIDPHNFQPGGLFFPATCVENELGCQVGREELLHAVLNTLFNLLPELPSASIMSMWQGSLAFLNHWVEFSGAHPAPQSSGVQIGKLLGLESDGSLKLLTESGDFMNLPGGEIHLNPFHGDFSTRMLEDKDHV